MIVILIKDFLKKKLKKNVFCEHQKNENEMESFILIEKTGSSKSNQLKSSTFAFQSYSQISLYEAMKLNEEVKNAVEELIELKEIASVKLNGDYNFTDEETKKYRYQAVFEIKHY